MNHLTNKNTAVETDPLFDKEQFKGFHFDNKAIERLQQSHAVLSYMKQGLEYSKAVKKAYNCFFQIEDERKTIKSKCTTQLDATKEKFVKWFISGNLLDKLVERNDFNEHEEKQFSKRLKDKEIQKSALKAENQNAPLFILKLAKLPGRVILVNIFGLPLELTGKKLVKWKKEILLFIIEEVELRSSLKNMLVILE